ncbi:5'-nucleotidase surE [Gossypium australe]|uniref:5'-nucleotidase surE n=1 Tax=Gossypium australe TaxID=47621 RepID=A0A5B6VE10_9ROSI|nr:5'-nucleotidase surE [Gossypium australe]
MEDELAGLSLLDEEEEAFQEEEGIVNGNYKFCLVGRCLTDSVVHFPSLRNTMADLWHPIGGICITDLGDKRYLFQFFHEVDIQRVIGGAPWFFNNHLLILQLKSGNNPGHSFGEDLRNQDAIIKSTNLGADRQDINGNNSWCNWAFNSSNTGGVVNGPMDLVMDEEQDPITILEGKKRQQILEKSDALLGANNDGVSLDLTASSSAQSSRAL